MYSKTKTVVVQAFFLITVFAAVNAHALDWHSMSQTARNQAILNTALQDEGLYVGQSCKDWVRSVVYEASSGVVWIPATMPPPNEHMWYWSPDVVGMSSPGEWLQPGWILQMKFQDAYGRWIPHTAIVVSVSSTGVTVVDSNWKPAWGQTVNRHFWSFTEFKSKFRWGYSVYYIR